MFFEPYRVSLIGHRHIEDCHLQDRLEVIVRELIDTHEYVEFMIGRNGDFDLMAASAIKTVQKNHRDDNSCLCLVLPYPVADMEYYEDYYNEVILPNELWGVHPKSAITKRNQWMIDNSDALIAYVEHKGGGAARCLHMAEKREIEIIRL